jgi:hypothetical protein
MVGVAVQAIITCRSALRCAAAPDGAVELCQFAKLCGNLVAGTTSMDRARLLGDASVGTFS